MRKFTFLWPCGPDCVSRSIVQGIVGQSIVRLARSLIKDSFSLRIKIRGSHIYLFIIIIVFCS